MIIPEKGLAEHISFTFNGYLFHGNEVITAEELKPVDTAYMETVMSGKRAKTVERYRDNLEF